MILAYIRVSQKDQNPQLQRDAITKVCTPDKIFEDRFTGMKGDRPEWSKLMDQVRPGDTVMTWSWDRVGRRMSHLTQLIEYFNENDITFRAVSQDFDIKTSIGRLLAQILGAVAEFEHAINSERRAAGQAARKKKGLPPPGRPSKVIARLPAIKGLADQGMHPTEMAKSLDMSLSSVYRGLELLKLQANKKE
jgi:DNA invertase Pin-like site-specific DNA recombinase